MQVAILGRQPKISAAELECLFGSSNVTPIGEYAALVSVDDPLPQARLGGTMKSAAVIDTYQSTDLHEVFTQFQSSILELESSLPEGKLQFGMSLYGFDIHSAWLFKQLLTLKKSIKKAGRSVRVIENKTAALETAQVLYNKLTGPLGIELLIIKNGAETIIARTTGVQDIDAYRQRDFERPKRDAYVGMLPPKLAQIMINLINPTPSSTILDPFCGTGVVLQEALLMGYIVSGTDIAEKMSTYSKINLDWLIAKYDIRHTTYDLAAADATTHTWQQPIDALVSEVYLGKPLTSLPGPQKLDKIMAESNQITEAFLRNLSSQIKSGTRLCLALPAWHFSNGRFKHLKVLDHLSDLGYNRLDLKHASWSELIYHRPDQVVARELTILEKK